MSPLRGSFVEIMLSFPQTPFRSSGVNYNNASSTLRNFGLNAFNGQKYWRDEEVAADSPSDGCEYNIRKIDFAYFNFKNIGNNFACKYFVVFWEQISHYEDCV